MYPWSGRQLTSTDFSGGLSPQGGAPITWVVTWPEWWLTNGSFAKYQNQLRMGHLAGCVSRKLCGSVDGSDLVNLAFHLAKHVPRLLLARFWSKGQPRGNRKGWTEFPFCKKGVRSLGVRGVREHASRGMFIVVILFYLCLSMFTRASGKSLATGVSGER